MIQSHQMVNGNFHFHFRIVASTKIHYTETEHLCFAMKIEIIFGREKFMCQVQTISVY